jgi:hypothetical protein
MIASVALLAVALAAAPSSGAHGTSSRVVLVPFENVARVSDATIVVMSGVELALAARGYDVVRGPSVEEVLREKRVRYLDSVPLAVIRELAERHQAGAVLVGSVLTYTTSVPAVAVSARLLSPAGECLWSSAVALASTETIRAFGRGRIRELGPLAKVAVGRLAETLPAPADQRQPGKPDRGRAGHVRAYRAKHLLKDPVRVAVLPLEMVADEDGSVLRVVDALLRNRLAGRARLTVVEPADLRAALVEEHVASLRTAGPEVLRKVGARVGTTLFLQGAVLRGLLDHEETVELHLMLVDVGAGRVLWSALHHRSKADFERMLGIGNVDASVTIADQVVLDLVESLYRGD